MQYVLRRLADQCNERNRLQPLRRAFNKLRHRRDVLNAARKYHHHILAQRYLSIVDKAFKQAQLKHHGVMAASFAKWRGQVAMDKVSEDVGQQQSDLQYEVEEA